MRASRISALYDSDAHLKSLTPQRKHRKLLKDGSSEVWPEDIERTFVQGAYSPPPRRSLPDTHSLGLREYWESPWATYSRGRSRWRNQFLVDFLHKNGVDRSKKQVASHIQVLRNMWKGEPEYHLVAGGEELFLETTLLPSVKAEDSPDAHLLTPPGLFDDYSPASDRSAGSVTSPCPPRSLCTGSSPTVASTAELTLPHLHGIRADDDGRRIRSLSAPDSHRTDPRRLSPLSSYWTCGLTRPPATRSPPSGPYTAIDQTFDFTAHYSPEPSHQPSLSDSPLLFTESSLFSADPSPSPIGLTRLSLWAEGMPSLSLPVDALISSTQPFGQPFQAVLRIKLHLPPIDVPLFPALHGFQGSITCTMRPSATVRCSTAIFVRGQCTSRESNLCTLMNADSSPIDQLETVTLLLPDSPLSRSRWLDSTSPTCIVQKIIVNDQVLAVIFYDLDRGQCESMPTAKLVAIQKYHTRPERTPSPQSAYHADSLLPTYTHMPGQCIPRSSLPNHTSYALSATINADTSLSGTSSYSTAFMMPSLLS
ncbi:hypothetical protein L210DRAFT_849030 [Boletus edulis BED1]|uniref:TEA domain-containing protein n=1 Tax=Boletus edulis BED1 TaxID=1328754 RepID=A0AAD4C4R0_BOLED|nr:hypothetical protein L210DRAFT_849030 [Boletus edulis BED1]